MNSPPKPGLLGLLSKSIVWLAIICRFLADLIIPSPNRDLYKPTQNTQRPYSYSYGTHFSTHYEHHSCALEFDLICYSNYLKYRKYIEQQDHGAITTPSRIKRGLHLLSKARSNGQANPIGFQILSKHPRNYPILVEMPYMQMRMYHGNLRTQHSNPFASICASDLRSLAEISEKSGAVIQRFQNYYYASIHIPKSPSSLNFFENFFKN